MVAMYIAINSAPHQQSLQASYKGKKGVCVVVGGCCSSVEERWWLKLEALGSTPGGTTFLSFEPFAVSAQVVSFIRLYWSSDHRGVLSIAVITLMMARIS